MKKRGSNFLFIILDQSRRRVRLTANMGSEHFSKKSCITSFDLKKKIHHERLFIDARIILMKRFIFEEATCIQLMKLYIILIHQNNEKYRKKLSDQLNLIEKVTFFY